MSWSDGRCLCEKQNFGRWPRRADGAERGLDPFLDRERYVIEDVVVYNRPRLRPLSSRSLGLECKTFSSINSGEQGTRRHLQAGT